MDIRELYEKRKVVVEHLISTTRNDTDYKRGLLSAWRDELYYIDDVLLALKDGRLMQ